MMAATVERLRRHAHDELNQLFGYVPRLGAERTTARRETKPTIYEPVRRRMTVAAAAPASSISAP
jgi:hypothetical protein